MATAKAGAAKAAPKAPRAPRAPKAVAPPEAAPTSASPAPAPHHAMAARRGAPGASYTVTDARGVSTAITADDDGLIEPNSGDQVRVADTHNLPYWSDPTTEAEADEPGEPAADETAEES